MCFSFYLHSRTYIILQMLPVTPKIYVAKKCKDPACITNWSKDYPGFQSAHK